MNEDPIVEEARRAGQAYIDRFKGDAKALLDDLRRRSEARGVKTVSLPPRAVTPRASSAQPSTRAVG